MIRPRVLIPVVAAAALALPFAVHIPVHAAVPAAPTGNTNNETCKIDGTGTFSPGLTLTETPQSYVFQAHLTQCRGSVPEIKVADLVSTGLGNLSCAGGNSAGQGSVTSNTGDTLGFTFTSESVLNVTVVRGTVTSASRGSQSQFWALPVTTVLAFNADASKCRTATGLRTLLFSGVTRVG